MSALGWFRLLHHATLALSCVCLLQAEQVFLPGIQLAIPVVAIATLVAWRVEGRWLLPVRAANAIALLIIAGCGAWVARQLDDDNSWMKQAPMPAGLVPPVGPVLTALLLVKLFRPRRPADFWLLEGMGLLQVGLACVLGSGPELGLVLPGYLICLVGCLGAHRIASGRTSAGAWSEREAQLRMPGWRLLFFAFAGAIGVGLTALVLFLVTPRPEDWDWEPLQRFGGGFKPRRTGRPATFEGLDLNATGWVDPGEPDAAFTVRAVDASGRPFTTLPGDQLWRGVVLDTYDRGLWGSRRGLIPLISLERQVGLPDLGAQRVLLTYTVTPREAAGLFLAEPITLGSSANKRLPVQVIRPVSRRPVFAERLGTVVVVRYAARQEYVYSQVFLPFERQGGRTPSPAFEAAYVNLLLHDVPRGLTEWTVSLLRRLEAEPRYHLAAALPATETSAAERSFLLDPDQWEIVAVALRDYLATSGDYAYTFERRRSDTSVDPVLDFLSNVKEGHCERFAAALALMLRSVGVPARVIKGYRGADSEGGGNYVVRQNQAHAWVEALVPSHAAPDRFDWLTLDPTPGTATSPSFSLARLWDRSQRGTQFLWDDLIVGYNSDSQADLLHRLTSGPLAHAAAIVGALAGTVVLLTLLRRMRLRWRGMSRARSMTNGALPGWRAYARLVALLSRYTDLQPGPTQTPRELAAVAATRLRAQPTTEPMAHVPLEVVGLYYRRRFGGQAADALEEQTVMRMLDGLERALRVAGPLRPAG